MTVLARSAIVRVAPGDDLDPAAEWAAGQALGVEGAAGHPDYEVYRPDGNVFRVGLVEELVFRSVLTPVAGDRRALAVLEPERMSEAAANLLLKTLEEPPPSLHLLFVTTRPLDLPATIRSRCAVIDAPQVDRQAPLRAAGVGAEAARRLAYLAGSSEKAARVAADAGQREALEAWVDLAGRVSPLPASCLELPEAVEKLVSGSPAGDEEARRRQRRERTDDLLTGLAVLAATYREGLARALGAPLTDPQVEADPETPVVTRLAATLGVEGTLSALRHVATAQEAILANGSARLAIEALALRLGALRG